MPGRPELVQFGDLTPSHFHRHPVWIQCHVPDYDEPWYGDTDEETFRPFLESLPAGPESGMLLVHAVLTLADGTRLEGFVTPAFPADVAAPISAWARCSRSCSCLLDGESRFGTEVSRVPPRLAKPCTPNSADPSIRSSRSSFGRVLALVTASRPELSTASMLGPAPCSARESWSSVSDKLPRHRSATPEQRAICASRLYTDRRTTDWSGRRPHLRADGPSSSLR